MFGSDNKRYVVLNEGLSAFNSGITLTESQVCGGGESSVLVGLAQFCPREMAAGKGVGRHGW